MAIYRHRRLLILRKLNIHFHLRKMMLAEIAMQAIQERPLKQRLQTMSPRERKKCRKEYPDMSPVLFMSEEQKVAYFEATNRSFTLKMDTTEPRSCPSDKTVSFSPEKETIRFYPEDAVRIESDWS